MNRFIDSKGLDQEIINIGTLEEIVSVCGQDASVLEKVIHHYLAEAPEQLQKLSSAISVGDCNEVFFEAHSLKSSSAMLGADSFSELCAEIEALGRNNDLKMIEEKLPSLLQAFTKVTSQLRKIDAPGESI